MSTIGLRKAARINAIHAACRQRGMDADARRDLQRALTGKASLTDMNFAEVTRVLDHLNQRTVDQEWRFVFRLIPERQTHARKIYRLAERLGALMDPPQPIASIAYVEGIASRMRGCITRLQFCDADQLHKIVQALEIHLNRHGG